MHVVKGVLFDYGLTLVSYRFPEAELVEAMEEARAWLDAPAPSAVWILDHVLLPLEAGLGSLEPGSGGYFAHYVAAWRRAGIWAPEGILYRILDLEQQVWDGAVQVAPGARAALRGLNSRGYRLGIASNAPFPPAMMRRQLSKHGFTDLVHAIQLSGEVGLKKPDPRFYAAAALSLGVAAPEVLHVGDSYREDYEGARLAGMEAMLCTQLARLAPPADTRRIDRLDELLRLLPGLTETEG